MAYGYVGLRHPQPNSPCPILMIFVETHWELTSNRMQLKVYSDVTLLWVSNFIWPYLANLILIAQMLLKG